MLLRSYLCALRNHLGSCSSKSRLTVVSGNESADMDSVVSALVYGYLSFRKHDTFCIPLINTERKNFKLRRDILNLLKREAITEDLLFFVDDLGLIISKPIDLVLVDHCNIQGEKLSQWFESGWATITGIIDHHADEGAFLGCQPRIITTSGSCSSLVFNYWYEQFEKKIVDEEETTLIELLLAPLILDTSYFSEQVEEDDVKAFEAYRYIIGKRTHEVSPLSDYASSKIKKDSDGLKLYYKSLKKAKNDVEGFSFEDHLMKDYKQYKFAKGKNSFIKIGFSSLKYSMLSILTTYSETEVLEAVAHIKKEYDLDVLMILTSFSKSDLKKREFAYVFDKADPVEDIISLIPESSKDTLDLNSDVYDLRKIKSKVDHLNKSDIYFKILNQGNTWATRKKVVPVVKSIIEGAS